MPNRVIKESIWTSPTVNTNIKKLEHCLALPWWILQADDWGCFDTDIDVVKGKVFPKRRDMTPAKVLGMRKAYQEAGLLFIWQENGGREWGYFVSFDAHHSFCNKKSVDAGGKQTKHRRKTPEPPIELLNAYIERFNSNVETVADICRQEETNSLNPNPNPNPNPKNNIVEIEILKSLNEKAGKNFKPTDSNLKFISGRLSEDYTKEQCVHVIEVKVEQWLNDPEMDKYLRPSTLFNPQKFAGYVNEKKGLISKSNSSPTGSTGQGRPKIIRMGL